MPVTNPIRLPELSEQDVRRFWSYVEVGAESKCWLWIGGTVKGYGQIQIKRHPRKAHRISFLIAYGADPSPLLVLHRCDRPLCVNPDHLFLGDNLDNMADCAAKRRFTGTPGARHWSKKYPHTIPRGEDRAVSKLTAQDVIEIRRIHADGVMTNTEIGIWFSVTGGNVGAIVKRKTWTHI